MPADIISNTLCNLARHKLRVQLNHMHGFMHNQANILRIFFYPVGRNGNSITVSIGIPGLIILSNYFPPAKRLLDWAKAKAKFNQGN